MARVNLVRWYGGFLWRWCKDFIHSLKKSCKLLWSEWIMMGVRLGAGGAVRKLGLGPHRHRTPLFFHHSVLPTDCVGPQ